MGVNAEEGREEKPPSPEHELPSLTLLPTAKISPMTGAPKLVWPPGFVLWLEPQPLSRPEVRRSCWGFAFKLQMSSP